MVILQKNLARKKIITICFWIKINIRFLLLMCAVWKSGKKKHQKFDSQIIIIKNKENIIMKKNIRF